MQIPGKIFSKYRLEPENLYFKNKTLCGFDVDGPQDLTGKLPCLQLHDLIVNCCQHCNFFPHLLPLMNFIVIY